MKIIVYSDSGHAWGKVKKTDIAKLDLSISTYSYQRGAYAYLEEDCDLPKFVLAWQDANPTKGNISYNEQYTEDSRIRSYERYEK
jgi:hypothetical protein